MPLEESRLWKDWERAVKKGSPNDFVMCITASSKTPVSGTGKTTLETNLCQKMDLTEHGFDATKKASLDAGEIAYELLPKIENHSSVAWDEAQGAPGTVGLDARRAMKGEAIAALSGILANRDKQLTIVITAQIFSMLDPRLYPMIDAWLLIRKGPDHPLGPVGTYHKVHVEDYNLKHPKVKTPAIEDFTWPAVPEDDPDYIELERLKQLAKTNNYNYTRNGENGNGDDVESPPTDISKAQRDSLIKQFNSMSKINQETIAEMFEISQQHVSRIVNS